MDTESGDENMESGAEFKDPKDDSGAVADGETSGQSVDRQHSAGDSGSKEPRELVPLYRTGGISINHLLSSNAADIGPITPLATPPPSPGSSKDTDRSMDDATKHSVHQRPPSRVIWPELFGSDD